MLNAVVAELLTRPDIGSPEQPEQPEQREQLSAFRALPMFNTMGIEVGHLPFSLALEAHTHRQA